MGIFSGVVRAVADKEVRHTASGKTVTTVRCADNYGWGDNQGVNWITVVMWGARGEKIPVNKGSQMFVYGEFRNREYERKDGTKGSSLEVVVNDIQFVGGKKDAQQPKDYAEQATVQADFEDDIPF